MYRRVIALEPPKVEVDKKGQPDLKSSAASQQLLELKRVAEENLVNLNGNSRNTPTPPPPTPEPQAPSL